jgi:3-oxoacyl-[acyl-carrier protein] reductase
MKYEGLSVVITGASRGLGLELADHFEGANVFDLSRTNGCDVSDPAAVRATLPPHVDILVNNAAVGSASYAAATPDGIARETVLTNLLGTFNCSVEAAKRMRSTGGRIINIGSIAVPFEDAGTALYTATKAGCEAMTGVLAKEFAPWGVTVNTVGVSALPTAMWAAHSEATQKAILSRLPLGMATFEDVFAVVDFFCSSPFITGQTIYLGGAR